MSKTQWLTYLKPDYKAAGLVEYPVNKQIFVDSIRASSTCPYIDSWVPDDDPRKPILDHEGYYITPYQPGDDPAHHSRITSSRQKKQWRFYGWTDDDFNVLPIEYKTNKNGFRDVHFSNEPGVACFGCSNTFGTGLHSDQTWPSRLQKKLGQKTWNLGTPGLSLEPLTWYALNWLDEDLPNLTAIALFVPPLGRALRARFKKEKNYFFFDRWKNLLDRETLDTGIKHEVLDGVIATSQIATNVGIKTLELIAKNKNIPFVCLTMDEVPANDWARDMQHKGPQTMDLIADRMKDKLQLKL